MIFIKSLPSIIKKKLKTILYVLIGLYIIFSPFYFKLLKIRLPKNIEDLSILFCIISLIIFLYLSLNILKIMLKKDETNLIQKFIQEHFIKKIKELYYNSIIMIDNYIKHDFLGLRFIGIPLLKITKTLNKIISERFVIFIILLFDIMPKILVLLVFIFDIFINNNLNYIYSFGVIILIPLIFRYIVYTFNGFVIANIRDLSDNYLCFYDNAFNEVSFDMVLENFKEHSLVDLNVRINFIRNVSLKNTEVSNFDETLDFYLEQLCIYTKLYNYIDFLACLKKCFYYLLLNLLLYFSFFLLWFYIILLKHYYFIS